MFRIRDISYRYQRIEREELGAFYPYYEEVYGPDLIPVEEFGRALGKNPDVAFQVLGPASSGKEKVIGFFDLIPLTVSGQQALDHGRREGKLKIEPKDIAIDAAASTVFYIGGIAARDRTTCHRAAIMYAFLRELAQQRAGRRITLYARPVTPEGLQLMRKFRFTKLDQGVTDSEAYWKRVVDTNDAQFRDRFSAPAPLRRG